MTIWQPKTSAARPCDMRPLDEDLVENVSFTGSDWSDLDQTGATFDTCRLVSPILDGVSWHRVRWVNSELERVFTALLPASESSWERVRLTNCRIGVLDLTDSSLKNLEFVCCKIDLLNLRGSRLTDLAFTDCTLNEVDMTNSKLTRLSFAQTEIDHLLISQASCTRLNLSGAQLGKITGLPALRGATISQQQLFDLAPAFAQELGISIV